MKQSSKIPVWRTVTAVILPVILALAAGCSGSGGGGTSQQKAVVNVSTFLTRSQENPAFTNFSSSGTGSISVDPNNGKINGLVVTTGIIGTAAQIRSGTPGFSGPVEIALSGGPTVWTIPAGTVLTLDQLAKLSAGQLYFNVQSAKFPNGEIRGQLNQQVRFSSLFGVNEIPPNPSTATGTGVLALDSVTRRVGGFVRTTGISGVAAHIHQGASGVAGPVVIPLAETAPGSGVWAVPAGTTLTPDQVAAFNRDELYYNVHSAAFPDGEIRGQILSASLAIKTASLDGAQDTSPVTTSASATGIAVVNSVTGEVFGAVKSAGISGVAAHIHDGDAGVAGPVIVPMAEIPAGSGLWLVPDNAVLNSDQVARFNSGGLYYNIHSALHPDGELRGQINIVGNAFTTDSGAPPSTTITPPPPVVPPPAGVSFSNNIQPIFDTYCIACHRAGGIAGFMPLTQGVSYANLVNVPAVKPNVPGTLVIQGNSANSVLYIRVSGILPDSTALDPLGQLLLRMPQGGPFLDELAPDTIPAIKTWIDEGALNN